MQLDQLNLQRALCLAQQKKLKPMVMTYLQTQPKNKVALVRPGGAESSMRYRKGKLTKHLTKEHVSENMRGGFVEWLKQFVQEVEKTNPAFATFVKAKMDSNNIIHSAQLIFDYIWASLPIVETEEICFPAKKKASTKRTMTGK